MISCPPLFYIALIGFLVAAQQVHADDRPHLQCSTCQKSCNLTVGVATKETECFEVQCKDICIPPVTLPWQCRPTRCGRVRRVNVLVIETREEEVCEYKWDLLTIGRRCCDALRWDP